MARYSPTVLPDRPDTFASFVEGVTGGAREGQDFRRERQRYADEEEERARRRTTFDLEMRARGGVPVSEYEPLKAPVPAGGAPLVPGMGYVGGATPAPPSAPVPGGLERGARAAEAVTSFTRALAGMAPPGGAQRMPEIPQQAPATPAAPARPEPRPYRSGGYVFDPAQQAARRRMAYEDMVSFLADPMARAREGDYTGMIAAGVDPAITSRLMPGTGGSLTLPQRLTLEERRAELERELVELRHRLGLGAIEARGEQARQTKATPSGPRTDTPGQETRGAIANLEAERRAIEAQARSIQQEIPAPGSRERARVMAGRSAPEGSAERIAYERLMQSLAQLDTLQSRLRTNARQIAIERANERRSRDTGGPAPAARRPPPPPPRR